MTAAVAFDEVRAGRLKLDDTFTVSKRAWKDGGAKSGGSTMFLSPGASVGVGDLLRGLIVQSGNDAAIVLAEGIAGSVEGFAALMNSRATAIGLADSHFTNPHGLPDPEQYVSARDLATLASHLVSFNSDLYAIFAEREFAYNKVRQHNRNRLLGQVEGADGLKTGWIEEAGYGLVGSAVRNGRRLIVVVMGVKSSRGRDRAAKRLLEWGFRGFEPITIFNAGETVAEARVFGGEAGRVPLQTKTPVRVTLPKGARLDLSIRAIYRGPIEAPIREGDPIGELRITDRKDSRLLAKAKLHAARDVAPGSMSFRAWDALADLVLRQFW
jgi:D-alanyl-D-alanine carboxypeptidase (penicillin-binding protein 5/6)